MSQWTPPARVVAMRGKVLLLLLLTIILCSCTAQESESDSRHARQIINQYLQAIKDERFDKAVSFFPEEQRQKWLHFLSQARQDKGRLQDAEAEDIEVNTVFSGTIYLVTVHTTNTKRNATEMITVFHKLTEDQPQLVSHKIKLEKLPEQR